MSPGSGAGPCGVAAPGAGTLRPGGLGWTKPAGVLALPASPWDNVGNYRPVRLTSVLLNIMEELIQDLINKKLEEVI